MSAVRVLDPGNEVAFWRENEWSPRFVKHKQLRSSAKSTWLTEIVLHSHLLEFSFTMSSSLE